MDDDCNGLIDEASDFVIGATTYKGWHDPVAQVAVGVDPFTNQPRTPSTSTRTKRRVPTPPAVSPGSQSTRACSNYGVLPWSNVTLAQAQAACAGIKDSAGPLDRSCLHGVGMAADVQRQRHAGDALVDVGVDDVVRAAVCNDSAEAEQRCNPAAKTCAKTCNSQNQCTCSRRRLRRRRR